MNRSTYSNSPSEEDAAFEKSTPSSTRTPEYTIDSFFEGNSGILILAVIYGIRQRGVSYQCKFLSLDI